MIDVRLLRTEPERVRAALARRNDPALLEQVDEATALDAATRVVASERDDLRRQVNELSKQVGRLRKGGDTDAAEAAMASSRALGERERALAEQADELEHALHELLLRIPNLPSDDAPDGARRIGQPGGEGAVRAAGASSPSTRRCRTGRPARPSASSTTSGP